MNKISRIAAIAFSLAGAALSQENYMQWAHYRAMTLNTTATGGGAGVSANVTGFPVLVRLSSAHADVFSQALAAGEDIRFTKADGVTRLAHETELWDVSGQSAAFWVRLDTAYGNNSSQTVRMYWGKAGAADSSNSSAVFRTSENYQGVWHLESSLNDATVNANNGTNAGSNDTAGAVGRGRYFNGTSDNISIANTATMSTSTPLSVEAWVKWETIGTGSASRYRPVINHGNSSSSGNQFFLYARNPSSGGGAPYYSFGYYSGSSTNDARSSDITSDADTWVHVAGTFDGAKWVVYRNGVFEDETDLAGTPTDATTPWYIGAYGGNSPERWFHGSLDEIRFSSTARDSNWMRLSYETQKTAGTALTIGSTQNSSTPEAITSLAYGDSSMAADTLVWETGVAVNIVPTYYGGPVDSFAITSTTTTLPAGVTLNPVTGVISGIPTAVTAAANRTITAYSTLGNATRTIRRSVVLGGLANLSYAQDTAVYASGLSVSNAPSWTGRAPTAFAVSPALPAGLSLSATTGVLSGTPTAPTAASNYTVTATNATDTATAVVRISVGAAESYSTWTQHKDWWLNTQPNGANTTKAVYNFPVLVRLDSTFNFAQAAGDGADIRFTKAGDAVRLPHQIDSWDSVGKSAAVWVKVDTIPASGIKALRMHWGKAGAANASSGAAVFDTGAGFQGVWHMNGATAGSNEPDATPNGLTATQNSSPATAAGIVSGARSFDGSADYLSVTGSASILNFPAYGNYSVSAWVNLADIPNDGVVVSKGDNAYALKLYRQSNWEFFEYDGASWNSATSNAFPDLGLWVHLLGVQDGFSTWIYVNGVLDNPFGLVPTSGGNGRVETLDLNIGAQTNTGAATRFLNGTIDEVRVHGVSRDTAWARLEYQNQRPAGQTLVSFAQPVSVRGALQGRSAGFSLAAKPAGNGLLFQIAGAEGTEGARKARLSLVDMWGRTVWSHTAPTTSGASRVLWNGQANNGASVSSGVYVIRAALVDGNGKTLQTLERKIPLTR